MPRATCVVQRHKRRKRILKAMKGARGGRRSLFATAMETYYRAKRYAFRDRKAKKREFRQLWITKISAALLLEGINYSSFMGGLIKAKIEINRKQLAEMAVSDPQSFHKIVELAKKHIPTPKAN